MFKNAKGGSRSKVVVVLSDGEDHEGGFEKEVETLRKMGVVVHGVGVGTQIGELIPDGDGKYLRSSGKTVMTRLQSNTLRFLSMNTGGLYLHSVSGDLAFEAILEELSRMHRSDYEARLETVYEEKFQLFALLAFVLLVAATLMPARARFRTPAGER
jgi:Ca-activated chloride channel family protein